MNIVLKAIKEGKLFVNWDKKGIEDFLIKLCENVEDFEVLLEIFPLGKDRDKILQIKNKLIEFKKIKKVFLSIRKKDDESIISDDNIICDCDCYSY